MQDNAKTLRAYDEHIREYGAGTPQTVTGPFKKWIDKVLSLIPKGGRILELGSGLGRDATYMEKNGYDVLLTDAPTAFVTYLSKHHKKVQQLNILTDELAGPYDLVFANGVFLHFTTEELAKILSKVKVALAQNGTLAFSVKIGNGSEWSEAKLGAPRFFQYWQAEPLMGLLVKTGFKIHSMEGIEAMKGVRMPGYQKWLHVVAQKP